MWEIFRKLADTHSDLNVCPFLVNLQVKLTGTLGLNFWNLVNGAFRFQCVDFLHVVNVVNLNFGETNRWVYITWSSFGLPHTLCSSFICVSASIYLVVLFLCVQDYKLHVLSPTEALLQVAFVLELEKGGSNSILCRFCVGPFWLVTTTGLTGR